MRYVWWSSFANSKVRGQKWFLNRKDRRKKETSTKQFAKRRNKKKNGNTKCAPLMRYRTSLSWLFFFFLSVKKVFCFHITLLLLYAEKKNISDRFWITNFNKAPCSIIGWEREREKKAHRLKEREEKCEF